MTLSRQLIVLILLLLLSALIGSLWIALDNTRDYLQRQSAAHAQDTANALGLAASTALEAGDRATVVAMAHSLFDGGDYAEIVVHGGKGLSVDLEQPVTLGVPAWFTRLLPLHLPTRSAVVMNAWRQAGEVRVRAHPGLAYRQLWNNARDLLMWFLAIGVIASALGLVLLRLLMRPLQQVEARANAICEQDFAPIEQHPRTRELARIVSAMNHATERVRRMLADKDRLVAALREQAYQHPVTHLPNRRFFIQHLERELDSAETESSGALLLIQVVGFKEYNDRNGYVKGDELLRRIATCLAPMAGEKRLLAHLNGADFLLLAVGADREQALALAREAREAVREELLDTLLDCRVGVALYQCPELSQALLSRADNALRNSLQAADGIGISKQVHGERLDGFTLAAWRDELPEAIEERRVLLALQPVRPVNAGVYEPQGLLQQEALMRLRLRNNGQVVPAGRFLPVAERLGLAAELDVALLEAVLRHLRERPKAHPPRIAVNLSGAVLSREADSGLLDHLLAAHHDLVAEGLALEVGERLVTRKPAVIRVLRRLADRHGVQLGVDHVGTGFESFGYLNALRPAYMKIDGSFIRDVESNADNQFYIQALGDICRGLGSLVVAECVESGQALRRVQSLGVDAVQGYWVGEPVITTGRE